MFSNWFVIGIIGLICLQFIIIVLLFNQLTKEQKLRQYIAGKLRVERQAHQFYAHQFKITKTELQRERQIHQLTKSELSQVQQTHLLPQDKPSKNTTNYSKLASEIVTPVATTVAVEYISKNSGKLFKSAIKLIKFMWSPF